MSNQIPVLYTEQKTKKVKIWLDGYLIPRPTLNSARLISAGKHEIDVVFYSSIDDIKPGREFETDRYLISVEESNSDDQPCPRPSFAVNDPTMKNRGKSAVNILAIFNRPVRIESVSLGIRSPRLVPKADPPSAPMPTLERHNPHQWGYAGTTAAMKRSIYDDNDQNTRSSYVPKMTKSSHFIPPILQKRDPIQAEEPPQPSRPAPPIPQEQPAGLLNDTLISRLLNNPQRKPSPIKQSPQISWSTWDDHKSNDEDPIPSSISPDENRPEPLQASKQIFNWHSLVQSAVSSHPTIQSTANVETMPKFDFDASSFDTLFDTFDE